METTPHPYQFQVIPQVCLVRDVCAILQLSEAQFYRLLRARKLALREVRGLDSTHRYTGESVAAEIKRLSRTIEPVAGERAHAPMMARRRGAVIRSSAAKVSAKGGAHAD